MTQTRTNEPDPESESDTLVVNRKYGHRVCLGLSLTHLWSIENTGIECGTNSFYRQLPPPFTQGI
jgi:hypothetical protein